jgi:hypothetical protein
MGDEQDRHMVFALQPVDQSEDLGLDRDVERCRRFVGDEEARLAGHRHGYDDPLAHPARQFMRVLFQAALRLGHAHAAQKLERPRARFVPPQAPMRLKSIHELPLDREDRIEGRHRLLKDHADLIAAELPHEILRGGCKVDRVSYTLGELEYALRYSPAAKFDQAHDGEGSHRLSGTRLPDKADSLSRIDRKRDAVHGDDRGAFGLELDP